MTTDPSKATLATKIPTKYRSWGYAASGFLTSIYFAYDLAYGVPKWATIPMAAVAGSGFYVANRNTGS